MIQHSLNVSQYAWSVSRKEFFFQEVADQEETVSIGWTPYRAFSHFILIVLLVTFLS